MKMGFGTGMFLGAVVGATFSIMAEENFKIDRSMKAMRRSGKNIGRCANRAFMSIKHMI